MPGNTFSTISAGRLVRLSASTRYSIHLQTAADWPRNCWRLLLRSLWPERPGEQDTVGFERKPSFRADGAGGPSCRVWPCAEAHEHVLALRWFSDWSPYSYSVHAFIPNISASCRDFQVPGSFRIHCSILDCTDSGAPGRCKPRQLLNNL